MFRLAIFTPVGNLKVIDGSSISTSSKINTLESHLESLQRSSLSSHIDHPCWKLPITQTQTQSIDTWTVKDELVTTLINLAILYNNRSTEIVETIFEEASSRSGNSDRLWLSSFKLCKKSLQFLNYLKKTEGHDSRYLETSHEFISFMSRFIQISCQQTFLSKTILVLKGNDFSLDFSINYSNLSRIAMFIKEEIDVMRNFLKTRKIDYLLNYIESLQIYNNSYLNTLLSIEFYKQDKIGYSLGYLNWAKDNFIIDEESSKFKGKLISLKQKLRKKLKINPYFLKNLNPLLQKDVKLLFNFIEVLDYKYNLENNNLKFDATISYELLKNATPSGRPIQIETSSWEPSSSASDIERTTRLDTTTQQYY